MKMGTICDALGFPSHHITLKVLLSLYYGDLGFWDDIPSLYEP